MSAIHAALQLALVLVVGFALTEQASVSTKQALPALIPIHNHTVYGRHLRTLRYLPPPPPPRSNRLSKVVDLTFDQVLDHFNPLDKNTWKQHYFARTELYEDGGPVFIYIGGEGQEAGSSLESGVLYMSYMAEIFKAKMFDLEHRYYGRSHPTPDLSSANLRYLSADQALADLAFFIGYLIEKGDIAEGQKIAVFGGSYPGNLAAWARIKYPHLIHAAVSSSAPVHAEADFVEYMEVVSRSMDKVAGDWCGKNVRMAVNRILQLLKTDDGYNKVKLTFSVASELKEKRDLDTFFQTLSNPFAGAVQYNRDVPNSPYSTKFICSKMAGDNLTPDQAMRKLAILVIGAPTGVAYDWSYKSSIQDLQNTEYRVDGSGTYDAMRQWTYQTCTEFGYFQTFSGNNTPFPKQYNAVDFSYQMCQDIFGKDYDKTIVGAAVSRTNLVFGDRKPDVTNIIFVNGDIDPWHALGILEDVSPDAQAVFIDGGSHCADMDYPTSRDPQPIIDAHAKIHKLLHSAMYADPNGDPADI